MNTKTLAIAGSIAALSLAAAPIAAVAASTHHETASAARVDRSKDARGVLHADRTPDRASRVDRSSVDRSRDLRDR